MNHIKKELQSLAMIKENITKLDKRKNCFLRSGNKDSYEFPLFLLFLEFGLKGLGDDI